MSEVKTYAVNCNDAWLNTEGDDISGSYVKYADYLELAVQLANAESKCREMAAENGFLKISESDLDLMCAEMSEDGWESVLTKTPATDAFLAEVRAQGVEMFALQQSQIAAEQEQAGDYEFSRHCSISATEACEFAEDLREGKCCEVQS